MDGEGGGGDGVGWGWMRRVERRCLAGPGGLSAVVWYE